MTPHGILETILYARDLSAAETFYRDVLGLEPTAKVPERHVFYRCGNQMLLLFNPDVTSKAQNFDGQSIPSHGAIGPGHLCFRASPDEIDGWKTRLAEHGVAIESEFIWPEGGRSIYFRDPAGNCLEFAEPRIWGLE
jgi:catechol 2,3-dioxygenase-like lactoylglutathione lyase family enzyme